MPSKKPWFSVAIACNKTDRSGSEVYLGVRDKDCGTLPIRAGHDDPIVISVGEINWEGSFRLEFHPHSGELLRVVRELWGISGEIVSQVVDPRTYMPKTEE